MIQRNNRKPAMFALAAVLLMTLIIPTVTAESLPPVENRPANTGYQPAFPGQTRAPGMKTEAPYKVEVLTNDLDSPWAVTALSDGRLIITQKAGTVRIYSFEHGLTAPIPGITGVANDGQGGLLDVAPAPDFEQSRLLYFTLAERRDSGSLTALGWGRLKEDESAIENFEILWRANPAFNGSGHFGSRLAFDSEGFLFVSTGDRQSDQTRPKAQHRDSAYGKIVRLTKDGQPAPGNPFEGQADALPELWSLGHRNVQGLAIHPVTGQLWASEMGPRGGDELNLIQPGLNYGWPTISYGVEYSGVKVGEGLTQMEGMEQPIYYWDPMLAASGMAFYTGDAIPEWTSNLFIGGLAGSHISRLKLEGDRVTGEERLLADEGQRFRDIADGPEGAIYAVTDQGRLYRIGL